MNPFRGVPLLLKGEGEEFDGDDTLNMYHNADTAANPAYQAALTQLPPGRGTSGIDPFREPSLWHGARFRYQELSIRSAEGDDLPALLFRPCDRSCRMPAGLRRYEPLYPAVVVMHGGAASQEMEG